MNTIQPSSSDDTSASTVEYGEINSELAKEQVVVNYTDYEKDLAHVSEASSPSDYEKDLTYISEASNPSDSSDNSGNAGKWEGDVEKMDNSPYPDVRAVVPTDDDPTIVLNHWRTWFLTTIFVVVFAGVNQFFSLRYPSLEINFLVAQVVCFPVGKLFAMLPDWKCKHCPFFDLNPGPFTKKEHAVVTIAVALTSSTAYAMYILNAQVSFYKMPVNAGYQLLLVWTSQMLGYGAAGLTRRWTVYPASCVWPQTLISISLFDSLHRRSGKTSKVNGWSITRYRFFLYVLVGSFTWYWVPGFLFKGLSYFNIVLWGPATRNNFVVNTIFGIESGLGVLPLTFDYTQISQAMSGSVFATPFYVSANTYASVLIFFVIVLPCLYFTNTWFAKYMPVISGSTYDNTQSKYNVTKILNEDFSINVEKYKAYSPVFVPFSYLLSYALNFAAVTAVFVHCYLYHGKEIWAKLKDKHFGGSDIHVRTYLTNYKDCPDWWYGVVQVIMIGLGFVTVCAFKTHFPAWAYVIALIVAFINIIPQGILEAMTNQHVGLNIITELICGYMLPLRPMANLLFKLYGFIVMRQGLNLSRDLKLALYMKVAPRFIFSIQIYATIISGLVSVGIQEWMRHNIDGFCTTSQSDGFTCNNGRTVFNASIIWSMPKYLFSPGRIYNPLLWFFLIGVGVTVVVYAIQRKWPKNEFLKSIHAPIFFTGPGGIPPSTPYNYSLFFAMSSVLFFIQRYWPRWFNRYNFVMGAGVETGVAIAVVVIFLCVSYPGGKLNWWGNSVYKNTSDYEYRKFYTVKKGETFGYDKWW